MASTELRLILVTPEKTLLDEAVSALRFPLNDGQIGVLPGRAPMVGRLGYGQLHFKNEAGEEVVYYIDGGFAQVKGTEVSILTNRAVKPEDINVEEAVTALKEASDRQVANDEPIETRLQDQERARQMKNAAQAK